MASLFTTSWMTWSSFCLRLASIASSGARCGVALIVSVDTKLTLPSGFSLADIEQYATVLRLDGGTFTWSDPEFSKWPLAVETPPPDDVFTGIVQRVGRAAKAAKREAKREGRSDRPEDDVATPEDDAEDINAILDALV